jgi:hypothetical protein
MSLTESVAGLIAGEEKAWTPSRLIDVFCEPRVARSGFRASGRKDEVRSDWHAGFCAYQGKSAYGPGIAGFDDGYAVWGELVSSGWTLIQDPGDSQFPYSFCMEWRPAACPHPAKTPAADAWHRGFGHANKDHTDDVVALVRHELDPVRRAAYDEGLLAGGTPDGRWCMASYSEGDFGVEVYDDETAYRQGERGARQFDVDRTGWRPAGVSELARLVVVAYSEVAMHMRVAGRLMWAEPVGDDACQLYTPDGEKFSAPILRAEAGLS